MTKFFSRHRTGDIRPLSSLEIASKYITLLSSADAEAMKAMRGYGYILDFVHNDAFGTAPLIGKEAASFWPAWFKAFPEYDFEVTRTIAARETIVAEWTFTGTNTGELGPPAFIRQSRPTGKTIKLRGVFFYDIKDGLIQHETVYMDLATLMVELGLGCET